MCKAVLANVPEEYATEQLDEWKEELAGRKRQYLFQFLTKQGPNIWGHQEQEPQVQMEEETGQQAETGSMDG